MMNERWYSILSELFINLSSGWFGTVIIAPTLTDISSVFGITGLLINLLSGIISLYFAYKFREYSKI